MPKVSVITPIYRTEKYLEKCLASLVAQSLADVEFIWIDNGGSDECREIIRKYEVQRPNIKVVHLAVNKGYGGAMNAGIEVATGEYIGFCDSDDWVDANYYEKLYQATQNGMYDIAFAEYKMEFDDGRSVVCPHLTAKKLATSIQDKIAVLKNGAIWDKLFRRSLICDNNIKFFENSRSYYEDNILLVQAAIAAASIAMVSGSYYHYVQHGASVIHDKSKEEERNRHLLKVIAYVVKQMLAHGFNDAEKEAGLGFISRSLSLKRILRQSAKYKDLIEQLPQDDFILQQLAELHNSLHLPWFKRLWGMENNLFGKNFYLLGIKFKLKKGTL